MVFKFSKQKMFLGTLLNFWYSSLKIMVRKKDLKLQDLKKRKKAPKLSKTYISENVAGLFIGPKV